jgi:hypothetical protein
MFAQRFGYNKIHMPRRRIARTDAATPDDMGDRSRSRDDVPRVMKYPLIVRVTTLAAE